MALFRDRYGSTPLHLLAHGAVFLVFAYVALQLADARSVTNIVAWFIGALILHDLVLLPFYSALDRVGAKLTGPGAVNYLRAPIGMSLLLLLLFYPPILGRNDGSFARVAGVEPEGYLGRWLLITAGLFALSAIAYAVRVKRR